MLSNEQQLTPAMLEAIRKRAEAATAGPWYLRNELLVNGEGSYDYICELDTDESDAEFIAHAREDVPALLAEIERLNSKIKLYESLAEECDLYPILNEMGALDDDEA